MNALICLLALAAGEPTPAPPLKLIVECEKDVPYSEPVLIDVSKSENVADLTFKVYPKKRILKDRDGRTAYFFGKPGIYTVLIVASGPDGKHQSQEIDVRVQDLSDEEWRSLKPPGVNEDPAVSRRSGGTAAQPAVLQRPVEKPDPLNIRQDVVALLGKVQSHDKDAERPIIAALYDRVGNELVEKKPVNQDQALAIVSGALFGRADPPVEEKWRSFSRGVRALLKTLDDQGSLRGSEEEFYVGFVKAVQTVQDVVGEVR